MHCNKQLQGAHAAHFAVTDAVTAFQVLMKGMLAFCAREVARTLCMALHGAWHGLETSEEPTELILTAG